MNKEIILPPAPEIYRVTTGYDDLILEKTNKFFDNILDFIGYNQKARELFTQRQEFDLYNENYFRLLIVRDQSTASVFVRRDDWNYCQVASALYLTPNLVIKLREGLVT